MIVVMNNITRNHIIPILQGYFATQPIAKAWLFGSYSRGEEKDGSDVDILVAFDKDAKISLLKYADIVCQLEALLKQKVDLVEEGTLFPFAQQTVNEDKILIYMSDKEMKSYRFSSGNEPSDEMLSQLMKEVAQEAKESNQKAIGEFFESLKREAKAIKDEWLNRQTYAING